MFITAGGSEVLLDSIQRFVSCAKAAGVDTTFQCVPGQQHSHELMAGKSKQADATLANAGSWLRSLLRPHG